MATFIPIKPAVLGGTYPITTPLTTLAQQQLTALAAITDVATKGDDMPNPAGRSYLVVINTDTTKQTISLQPLGKPSGMTIAPYAADVQPNAPYVFGPFDPSVFNNQGGTLRVALSGAAANAKVIVFVIQVA